MILYNKIKLPSYELTSCMQIWQATPFSIVFSTTADQSRQVISVYFIHQLHFCFQKSSFLLLDQSRLRSVRLWSCLSVCTAVFYMHIFTFAFILSDLLTILTSRFLPPLRPPRSDARLQPEGPPPCSPRRRSLASRSRLHRTLSIASTPTSTSRSRSSSGCRGNGSRSSRTRPRGPNLLSTPLLSLLWSHARCVLSNLDFNATEKLFAHFCLWFSGTPKS